MSPAAAAQEVKVTVDRMCQEINLRARSYSARSLNHLRNAALEVLGHDGSGRVYKRRGGYHVASAPGQPPAPDTGNLRRNWNQRSYFSKGAGKWGLRIRLQLKSKMFYAIFQEGGTRYIIPRPFKERIRAKARPKIAALFADI